jgi:hypothetical protein
MVERVRRKHLSTETHLRRVLRAIFLSAVCSALFLPVQLSAQEPIPSQAAPAIPTASALVTVQGVVSNSATGQALPRALVRIEGDAEAGSLTDNDGRFEIPGVPAGPQAIQVMKPGYRDRPRNAGAAAADDTAAPAHNVLVSAEMPELSFTLEPTSSIHGLVEFSTGEPAEGITINLLKRTVEDGRSDWTPAAKATSNSEGAYHFASLADGVYVMYTEPSMEDDRSANPFAAGAGYASIFYPDARELAGAARIQLSPGDQAQANLTLTLEPFQKVSISVALPQDQPLPLGQDEMVESAVIMDAAGHQLPYHAIKIMQTPTLVALLPDGSYSLLVSQPGPILQGDRSKMKSLMYARVGQLAGTADFSVAGHEVTNVRVPVSVPHPNPVELTIVRTSLSPAQANTVQGEAGQIVVMLSQTTGWIGQGMVSAYASGSAPGPMEAAWILPGAYWVHTNIAQKGLCEASFTAGGANLAREPVILGLNGSASPMTLTLRDDCAKLTLSLPQSLVATAPGEEPFYTVYVVPDFDSTVDVVPVTLRPSTGGAATLEDLTPGSYHVYTFNATARLEYRDPAVLAALPNHGQSVTLSAGTVSNLVLEAPEP